MACAKDLEGRDDYDNPFGRAPWEPPSEPTTRPVVIYGGSDDLIEVEGPCIDEGQTTVGDSGEYNVVDMAHTFDGVLVPRQHLVVCTPDGTPYARVYAVFDGAWSFALAGIYGHDDKWAAMPPEAYVRDAGEERSCNSMALFLVLPDGHYVKAEPQT